MENNSSMNDLSWFTVWFGLSELLGAVLLILMGIWLSNYRGGFSWTSNPKKEFNWHPLLMTIGMIFLYANAILIYRTFRNTRKKTLKITHAAINMVAFICSVIGLRAAFDSHNLASPPIPNMYSLHSWFGLGAVIIFVGQWISGFVAFLYPTLSPVLRAAYLPVHTSCGRETFALACITALLGLTEKAIFSVPNYSSLPAEAFLVNSIGFIIILYMAFILYMVSLTKYKRQPLPEDEMLLTAQKSVCCTPRGHSDHIHLHHHDLSKEANPSHTQLAAPRNVSTKRLLAINSSHAMRSLITIKKYADVDLWPNPSPTQATVEPVRKPAQKTGPHEIDL